VASACAEEPKSKPSEPVAPAQFQAILFTAHGKYPHEVSASVGDFTLDGPKEGTLRPLPKGIRQLTYDPSRKEWYGLSAHEIYKVDLEKAQTVEMKLPDELPKLSWPCGIAFDSRRDRVIVVSLGGVGHMYSFSTKAGKWSLVSDMNNLDLAALTYDAKADRLHGIYQKAGDRDKAVIGSFNAKGALIETIELSDPAILSAVGRIPGGKPVHLAPIGESLAIVTENRIFEVGLKSQKVTTTWSRK
jgi:hypothetical protein